MRALAIAAVCASLTLIPATAAAAPVPAGVQPGTPMQAAVQARPSLLGSQASCNVTSLPVIGVIVNTITNGACKVGGAIAGGIGDVAGAVGSGVLGLVASWLIGAATQVTGFLAAQMTATTTPQLKSSWFAAQFQPMAALGAGLALLVALVALASAAVRRSPDALAATLAGMVRAGLGTGMIVALTAIALAVADDVSNQVAAGAPHQFWNEVAHAWGHSGWGGFGSSALAALIALVEVFAALFVWVELIVRNAAIYIAVLFFPVALAASIWQPLAGWTSRLARVLLALVILKPVTLIVLALAGNAAAAGLTFHSAGISSVGTILAAVVIFALAAFTPWTLMYLLAADAEAAWTTGALRTGAGQAATSKNARSVRTGGGLATLANRRNHDTDGGGGSGRGGGGGGQGGGGQGGGDRGGGNPSGGRDGGGNGRRPGSAILPTANGDGRSGGTTTSPAVASSSVAAAAGIDHPNSGAGADTGQAGPSGRRGQRTGTRRTGPGRSEEERQPGNAERTRGRGGGGERGAGRSATHGAAAERTAGNGDARDDASRNSNGGTSAPARGNGRGDAERAGGRDVGGAGGGDRGLVKRPPPPSRGGRQ
jgi:hypothetical protein